jgi:propanol-preferring alcohol dehydrogenase
MILQAINSLDDVAQPLALVDLKQPVPAEGELLLKVSVCGVCHTELDEIEGRTPPPVLPVVPGHEVVGRVEECGEGCRLHSPGDRVGVGWIHSSDGSLSENTSEEFRATGRDVNGGYAEYMTVPESYAYPIPDVFPDVEAAPLLCAGGVGYRALKLAGITDRSICTRPALSSCLREVKPNGSLRYSWVRTGSVTPTPSHQDRPTPLSIPRQYGNPLWPRWSACDPVAGW